jgi:release factor glutamine methyltransferase
LRIRDIIEQQKGIERIDTVNIVGLALSMQKEEIFTNLEREVDEAEGLLVQELLAERRKGKPLAYIAKSKEFFSENFYVDERVLIPRPETEIIVEEALALLETGQEMNSLLDMGTGSGAIGIILAKKTQKHVVCADISLEALRVAKQNGESLGVSRLTRFICSDLFGGIKGLKFDMILANLPYVAREEWDSLMTDVKDYEPRGALDGGTDGTIIYKRFIEGLPHHLNKKGFVLCEVGGRRQAEKIREMFRAIGVSVVEKNDLSGIERVLIGSWTSLS